MEYSSDANARAAYVSNAYLSATGGTETTVGSDKVHTFASSGTFIVTGSGNVQVLVVGGGANSPGSGIGGGAGQYIYNSSFAISSGSYTTTINGPGGTSVFSSITANPGSGGTSGNGYTYGSRASGPYGASNGAGGGSSANGGNAANYGDWTYGGTAGAGTANSITGTSLAYACGGSGGPDGGGSNYAGMYGSRVYGDGQGSTATLWFLYEGSSPNPCNALGGVVIIRYTPVTTLQSYSESTIKTQGSYSLKGVATTGALNKTLTRTIGSPIDLTGASTLKFDIRASRTGSNIKIGIRDSGGTTTETTPNITSADAWQTVSWDISGVSNANKDAIDRITITVVNADAANTFYIDNIFSLASPTISTSDASAITSSQATLNGNITDTGGENNTVRGFQYGLDTGYGSDTHTTGSYGTGVFSADISSLSPNTAYHFRAYSTNSIGTSYGADTILTTSVAVPVVATNDATSITSSTATLNGDITSIGGSNVLERGFDWGVSSGNYLYAWTEAGSFGTGTFDHPITGSSQPIYYFRAKVRNPAGWAYGSEMSFLTGVRTTGTLLSFIFDTGVSGGVAFNSIMWLGNQPAGSAVGFQFASSNSTSSFPTPTGPGGTSLSTDTYNPTGSGIPIALSRAYHNNYRYFRYQIILVSNSALTAGPRVDDVIINWSP
ncbi:MAG: hypothetical protein Q8N22_00420 [bacterium]|nr:hypothetical protein [bacterium]